MQPLTEVEQCFAMLLASKIAAHLNGASLESRRAPLKDGPEDNLPAPSGTFFYAAKENIGHA